MHIIYLLNIGTYSIISPSVKVVNLSNKNKHDINNRKETDRLTKWIRKIQQTKWKRAMQCFQITPEIDIYVSVSASRLVICMLRAGT